MLARRFEMHVEIGNAAMSEPEHLAYALRQVAEAVERHDPTMKADGIVRDENGNTVGRWSLA